MGLKIRQFPARWFAERCHYTSPREFGIEATEVGIEPTYNRLISACTWRSTMVQRAKVRNRTVDSRTSI